MACTRTRGSEDDDGDEGRPPSPTSTKWGNEWLDKSEGAGNAVRLVCFFKILRVASELAA